MINSTEHIGFNWAFLEKRGVKSLSRIGTGRSQERVYH